MIVVLPQGHPFISYVSLFRIILPHHLSLSDEYGLHSTVFTLKNEKNFIFCIKKVPPAVQEGQRVQFLDVMLIGKGRPGALCST